MSSAGIGELSDAALLTTLADLERRRPGAPLTSTGIRPRRRPWTYRDIWRLETLRTEATRRGLADRPASA
jgi:hypothetical protein